MTWEQRIANYVKETGYPRSLFIAEDGRAVGTWIMGNDYRVKSRYHGGYPATYLKRVRALFPDKHAVLHLFSGRVDLDLMPGRTVDVNPALNPSFVDDAQTLTKVPVERYDLLMCDPPYTGEDSEHYGTPMVQRNKVMKVLGERCVKGTHVVWLDQVLPIFRKTDFQIEALIGICKSTNHRFRIITIFKHK